MQINTLDLVINISLTVSTFLIFLCQVSCTLRCLLLYRTTTGSTGEDRLLLQWATDSLNNQPVCYQVPVFVSVLLLPGCQKKKISFLAAGKWMDNLPCVRLTTIVVAVPCLHGRNMWSTHFINLDIILLCFTDLSDYFPSLPLVSFMCILTEINGTQKTVSVSCVKLKLWCRMSGSKLSPCLKQGVWSHK